MQEAQSFLEGHIVEVFLGVLGLVGLGCLLRWLNKLSKEELEHQKRFQGLKETSGDRYKNLRPLK